MPQPPLSAEKRSRVESMLAANRYTNAHIAKACVVSAGTVSNIRSSMPARLNRHARAASINGAAKRYLLLPDMHYPVMHRPTWDAVKCFMRSVRVDGVVWTGDQLDLEEISHWNANNPGKKGRGALKTNLDGYRLILDEVDELLQPGALKRWHRGNHERFVQDFYEDQPQLEGMLDLEEYLGLADRGYEIFKLGKMSTLGKLGIIHGDQVGSGMYVAKKLLDTHCKNMVMGHVHTASSFTKVSASDAEDKWMGWTLPTMGTVNPAFARNRVNAHVNGFGIVEVLGDGHFNLYTVITDTITGAFAYGGHVFSGA